MEASIEEWHQHAGTRKKTKQQPILLRWQLFNFNQNLSSPKSKAIPHD